MCMGRADCPIGIYMGLAGEVIVSYRARRGLARLGWAWQGRAWRGQAGPGAAGQGKARRRDSVWR